MEQPKEGCNRLGSPSDRTGSAGFLYGDPMLPFGKQKFIAECKRRILGEQFEFLEIPAHSICSTPVEPILKKARVNRPEIGVMLEVALIQILETRVFAMEAGLHRIANQKHLRCCAVVGAKAAILLRGAAEF